MPPAFGRSEARRPYFETLIVTGVPATNWPNLRPNGASCVVRVDAFIYEPVIVGSLEDAFCAAMLNPNIAAVVINEGFALRSRHDAPVLRTMTVDGRPQRRVRRFRAAARPYHQAGASRTRSLSDVQPRRRDRWPEIPRPTWSGGSSIPIEELLELHLSILEGIQDRYDTPFFDNLKKYAQRPIGTFHALPIARGKSVFRSDWIRDMGEFYGLNLFLAESSATTGGLDSLLEPTGNIKKAQDKAARALGADRVFFVTNGTSTSNKMAVQALLAPGDIAIVDRNCHKSHHYGMVLAGAQPLYVEAFPMTEYSMYGAVPLKTIKQALLDLKADGRLASGQDARPDQLHLRRPHLQHPPGDGGMPRHQAGSDLPVGRSLVRLCALFAVPAAAHRDGRRQRHRGLDARSEIGRRPTRSSRPNSARIRPTKCCSRPG